MPNVDKVMAVDSKNYEYQGSIVDNNYGIGAQIKYSFDKPINVWSKEYTEIGGKDWNGAVVRDSSVDFNVVVGLGKNANGQFVVTPIYSDVTILNKFQSTPSLVYESKKLDSSELIALWRDYFFSSF